jgi:hypothetical protein
MNPIGAGLLPEAEGVGAFDVHASSTSAAATPIIALISPK